MQDKKEIFVDGIGRIHFAGGMVRFDFVTLQPEVEGKAPVPVVKERVIMPPLIDFTAPDRYPTDPDAGKVPAPWNDPLAEFLRLGLKLKTVPDETGEPHIYSDDIIAVRGEDHE